MTIVQVCTTLVVGDYFVGYVLSVYSTTVYFLSLALGMYPYSIKCAHTMHTIAILLTASVNYRGSFVLSSYYKYSTQFGLGSPCPPLLSLKGLTI